MKLLIVSVVIFFIQSMALAARPSKSSCDYYQDVEEAFVCGKNGYPLKFGHRLCQRYLNYDRKVSPSLKKWFSKVRFCLQNYLESEQASIRDCSDLKQKAYDSHLGCYLETVFCQLSWANQLKIIELTNLDLLNPQVLLMGSKISLRCNHSSAKSP